MERPENEASDAAEYYPIDQILSLGGSESRGFWW